MAIRQAAISTKQHSTNSKWRKNTYTWRPTLKCISTKVCTLI